jgi:hypothetical protein
MIGVRNLITFIPGCFKAWAVKNKVDAEGRKFPPICIAESGPGINESIPQIPPDFLIGV